MRRSTPAQPPAGPQAPPHGTLRSKPRLRQQPRRAPAIPEALQAPDATPGVDNFTPFAYGDFTWLNGTPRNKDTVLDTKFFTPEVRFDTHFMDGFQSTERPHHGRLDRVVPVRRIPGGADQRRRRLPLAKRSRPNLEHVRDCSPPRRRAMTPAPESANGTCATLTTTFRKPGAAITST